MPPTAPQPFDQRLLTPETAALLPLLLVGLLVMVLLALSVAWRWMGTHLATLWGWASAAWTWLTNRPLARRLARRYPGVWSFLARRLSPGEYLGLHLTAGLLISMLALGGFAGIAYAVAGRAELVRFDLALAGGLHRNATPWGADVFRAVTWLGAGRVLLGLGLLVGLALALSRRWLFLAGWIIALAGSNLLNVGLKALFARPRPSFATPLAVETTPSFPSGHALVSLVAYGMLAYFILLSLSGLRSRLATAVAAASLILFIGFSRLYLGVHYFSDVIGGYAAGAVWLAACVSGLEVARRRGEG